MTGVHRSELTPVAFLQRAAFLHPARVAIAHEDGRRISYGELQERCNRLANALRARGLRHGDRVAVLSPNAPAILEAHYAVPLAGGVLVAINTRLAPAEITHILRHSGARMLLVDHALAPLVETGAAAAIEIVRIDDSGRPDDPYEQLIAEGSPEPPPSRLAHEEEPISINYTSGTTGSPKGVVYTHRGAYLNALAEVIVAGLTPDSVYLWTLPMFHCNGWCFPWAVTAVAARHVTERAVDAGRVWELIDREGVSHYNGAPTVHLGVSEHASARRLDRPVTILAAAAPPSPTLLARLEELNFRVVHVYGLTETYGPITVSPEPDGFAELDAAARARILARQGQAYPTADLVRVVDADDADVPRDGEAMGEVVMRGNNVMLGYHDDPEGTAEAFRGGWFHSGDLAVWHPDGTIELRDRAKDVIISGGENISTIEVEQTLAAHPAVLECAVIAIPHERWGERPKAFVTLREGADATPQDLIEHCRARIARFKAPDAVEFGPLPKTSTGKVQKYVLRDREWGNRTTRIN
jgi:fatty-acyl-CoA synthase